MIHKDSSILGVHLTQATFWVVSSNQPETFLTPQATILNLESLLMGPYQ